MGWSRIISATWQWAGSLCVSAESAGAHPGRSLCLQPWRVDYWSTPISSQMEKILATFDHYIIMDDVEVKNLSEQMTALGIAGPNRAEVLAAAGIRDSGDAAACRFERSARGLRVHRLHGGSRRRRRSSEHTRSGWRRQTCGKLWDALLAPARRRWVRRRWSCIGLFPGFRGMASISASATCRRKPSRHAP